MSASPPPMVRKRKQRADVACDFCRKRKLGCDNAKPKCENCYAYQKDCTYTVKVRKERPSFSRTNELQNEVGRLSKVVKDLQSSIDDRRARQNEVDQSLITRNIAAPCNVRTASPSTTQGVVNGGNALVAEPHISSSAQIPSAIKSHGLKYHGPTSAMFDGDTSTERKATCSHALGTSSQKTQLLAEAAKQRQLELVNSRAGKLNCGGCDPQTARILLATFWNRQHATGSVVYRPSFMRDMASQGPYFSELLLNAIYFISSKHISSGQGKGACDITDTCNTGTVFRRNIESLLYNNGGQLLCKSSITTIQALLLFSDALFSWCDERSLSWHYLGIAANMIIDLGIHSEGSRLMSRKSENPEAIEIHRRVFWAAFVLDKIQSIYQGRPARLRDTDSSVPISFLDEYEELEPFDTIGYSASTELGPLIAGQPTYSVSTFEQLCKLSTIADHILDNLYAEKSPGRDSEELLRTSQSLHADLTRWYASLPDYLKVNNQSGDSHNAPNDDVVLPHILCLTLMYHAFLILLHRPFVSEGHLKSVSAPATSSAFSICETAATDIDGLLRSYKKQWCIKSPPYFLSYATYVSATIHVRIAAQRSSGSKAHRCLLNCLEILSEHQSVCHAPRRSMSILLGLVKRLNVQVGREFTAEASRTADHDMAMPDEINDDSLPSSSRNGIINVSNWSGGSNDTGDMVSQPLDIPSVPDQSTMTQVSSLDPMINSGWEEQFSDIFFDIDPIFGFDMSQAGSEGGFTI